MEPDSAQSLYLPPTADGKRGVWLQPGRTFADYMEGVRIFGGVLNVPIFDHVGLQIFFQLLLTQGLMADDAMAILNDKVIFKECLSYI